MEASPRSERATLSRDLNEFLIELSIALHRHSMYPGGHPALIPAIESVVRRAEKLLDDRPQIAFGVGRRQLIIDGVATDPDQPVLRRLADGLHRHHIGAVSIMRGADAREFGEALRTLSAEPERQGPVGLALDAAVWPHIKLQPLTFDGLSLVGDDAARSDADSERSSSSTDLWLGLAKAALATKGSDGEPVPSEAAVARAIDEDTSRDQIVIGYLLEIARELRTASGEAAEELKRRTARLIASLNPATLRRLVSMSGDRHQRAQFLRDMTQGLPVEAVLTIVKASADTTGQTISHGLVRMLTKLAAHAEGGSALTQKRADVELREQVGRLLEDWRLEDPNPEAYGRVLEHLATSHTDTSRSHSAAAEPEPLRLIQMSLEAGAVGPLADKAVDQAINAGQLSELLELIASPPEGGRDGADTILARLTRPENLKGLFANDRVDLSGLDQLLPRLSIEGYEPLLDALGLSPSRIVRRRLLDLLGRTPVDISALVIARLNDERWYVQRNMLMLLARSRHLQQNFSVVPWTQHPDARVRSEAIRLQLLLPNERHLGVDAALNDADPRIVHLGLTAIGDTCPPALVDRVIDLALADDLGQDSRVLAVSSLARARRQDVLNALLQLSVAGRSLFGRRTRLLPKTPVLLAVVRALSMTWSDDRRASGVLAAARRASDRELRQAVTEQAT